MEIGAMFRGYDSFRKAETNRTARSKVRVLAEELLARLHFPMFHVYILKNPVGRFYTERGLERHKYKPDAPASGSGRYWLTSWRVELVSMCQCFPRAV